jgi:hypothetical protein
MPGLSSDPAARQKQLEALQRGRRTQAKQLLEASDNPPQPASVPRETPPAKSGPKKGSYPEPAKPKERRRAPAKKTSKPKKSGAKKPAAHQPPAEPERPRRRGLGGLVDGIREGLAE